MLGGISVDTINLGSVDLIRTTEVFSGHRRVVDEVASIYVIHVVLSRSHWGLFQICRSTWNPLSF